MYVTHKSTLISDPSDVIQADTRLKILIINKTVNARKKHMYVDITRLLSGDHYLITHVCVPFRKLFCTIPFFCQQSPIQLVFACFTSYHHTSLNVDEEKKKFCRLDQMRFLVENRVSTFAGRSVWNMAVENLL